MADKIKPLKLENPATGGTENDGFPTEADPSEDYITGKGFAFENNDNRLIDLNGSGQIQFKDAIETSYITVRQLRTAVNNLFDNTSNGFIATNVQAAIEEIAGLSGQNAAGNVGEVQYRGTNAGSFAASNLFKWSTSKTALIVGTDPGNLNNLVMASTRSINSFLQSTIQNTNAGTNASTDIIAQNDLGDDDGYYVDLGINSSGNADNAYPLSAASDSYLYNIGGHFTFGTADRQFGTGALKDVIFHTGGFLTTDERFRLKDATNAKDAQAILKSVLILDKNTTANRPTTPLEGMLRYNTTDTKFEFYENGVWSHLGGAITGDNVGTGTGTIFKQKVGETLQFKTLKAGTFITLQNDDNEIIISATGTIASGIVNYKVNDVSLFSTTSNSYVVLTGMTVTPEAGLYAIWINFSANTSAANKIIYLAVFRDGTMLADSERDTLAAAASQSVIQSTQTTAQFNGSETCDLRVKVSGNTLHVAARSMILIRLG